MYGVSAKSPTKRFGFYAKILLPRFLIRNLDNTAHKSKRNAAPADAQASPPSTIPIWFE